MDSYFNKKNNFMKKNFRLMIAAFLALSITFVSCKKTDTGIDDNTELATHSDDQSRVAAETDAVANDADASIEEFAAFGGRSASSNSSTSFIACGATAVLDSTATDRRITITYDGTNCGGTRTRTGIVVLTMPLTSRWREVGAILTVNVQNLRITRLSDNKSITINGIKTITNTSGGRLFDLPTAGAGATRIHDIASAGVTVTFDDGTQRTWQIAKRRTFTYSNGFVLATVGTHTDGNITGISEWGTNRFGNAFVASITQPMVIREDCSYRLVSGQVTHQRLFANVVTTFGLDAAGNPTSCPANFGAYYFKAVWTGVNGVVRTVIYPY